MLNAAIIPLLTTISAKTVRGGTALNMYKWHWLQSEGKYQGLAAIICGAGHPTIIMPNNPTLSSSAKKTMDIPFFFLACAVGTFAT